MSSTEHFEHRSQNRYDDLSLLMEILEQLLQSSGDLNDQKYIELKIKAKDIVEEIKTRINGVSDTCCLNAKEAVYSTEDYIRHKPWHGIGISLLFGVFCGVLIAKR